MRGIPQQIKKEEFCNVSVSVFAIYLLNQKSKDLGKIGGFLTLKAFLINADSLKMTARSSAAVLQALICFITSLNFKFDIFPTNQNLILNS